MSCISLATSTACPMYASYSIKSGPIFDTVEGFDRLVQNRIKADLSKTCASFQNEGLRYQLSFGCSLIVGISKGDCSNPPPVCQTFLNATIQSMNILAKGACSSSIPEPIQNHLIQSQSAGEDCLAANPSESKVCGFSTLEEQKQHCFRNEFQDSCCESFSPAESVNGSVEQTNVNFLQKSSDRYLGTSMFIFTVVGTTIGCIILSTLIIYLILKRQIQKDRKPLQKRIPEKVASRTSFYF